MDLVEMDLDLDEVSQKNGSLRACPRSVLASGRGNTPLHGAVSAGKTAVVELLLAANAPVDVQNKKGRGPQRITVCLEIVIHRSFQQKSHLLRQPPSVHIFRV